MVYILSHQKRSDAQACQHLNGVSIWKRKGSKSTFTYCRTWRRLPGGSPTMKDPNGGEEGSNAGLPNRNCTTASNIIGSHQWKLHKKICIWEKEFAARNKITKRFLCVLVTCSFCFHQRKTVSCLLADERKSYFYAQTRHIYLPAVQ